MKRNRRNDEAANYVSGRRAEYVAKVLQFRVACTVCIFAQMILPTCILRVGLELRERGNTKLGCSVRHELDGDLRILAGNGA